MIFLTLGSIIGLVSPLHYLACIIFLDVLARTCLNLAVACVGVNFTSGLYTGSGAWKVRVNYGILKMLLCTSLQRHILRVCNFVLACTEW